MMPRMMVNTTVSTIAGRSWRSSRRHVRSGVSAFAELSGAAGGSASPARPLERAMKITAFSLFRTLALCRQVQRDEDQVDELDANERQDNAAEAVEQQVAPQDRRGAERAILHAAQGQRNQRNDDQRVEDYRREHRAMRRRQPHD